MSTIAKIPKGVSSRKLTALPNELIVLIFRTCPQSDRAMLSRVSKRFHHLGVDPLYRSILITNCAAVQNLRRTVVESNGEFAKAIRVLNVLLARVDDKIVFWNINVPVLLQAIILQSPNIKTLQFYTSFPPPTAHHEQSLRLWAQNPSPKCLTSLTFGVSWYMVNRNVLKSLLDPLAALEHLSIQCTGDYFSPPFITNVEVTLPNLLAYHGPSILLESLAKGSKKLSSLILEIYTPLDLEFDFALVLAQDPTLRHLKNVGSKGEGEPDAAALSFLKIICDTPAAANVVLEFIPQVAHFELLCTSMKWITPERLPTHPWHSDLNLDFLSRITSLRIFSLQFVHIKQSLPWDVAVIADSLGEMNAGLVEVNIYGHKYQKSATSTTGKSWSPVLV
ncbi:hypothetical protein C8R42DRAFT_779351 [Lentinula raphanica]|nr:hypothetical protein C8R42DRAFT_779351 [Lentinula raphanica]